MRLLILPLVFLFMIPVIGQEINQEIWTLQASSVAQELALKQKPQKKLTEAYLEFRKDMGAETATADDDFHGKLAEILGPDQAERTHFVLGSMNNRWDQYLEILIGFNLEEESLNKASTAVYEYITEYLTERKNASDAGTRFSGRISTALKEKLDSKISGILSEEQYAAWNEATARKKKTTTES